MTAEKTQELVQNEESRELAPPQGGAASMLSMIERASRDESVSIEKMERLYELYEREQTRQAERAFNAAMSAMQNELPVVTESGAIVVNGQTRSRYAKFEDLNDAVKPVLQRHGFSLTYRTETRDQITVTGILAHESGHREQTEITLPTDASGSKNPVQAVASSISYGKRYVMQTLLPITTRGEDDDGMAAGAPQTITDKQVGELTDHIAAAAERSGQSEDAIKQRFLSWVNRAWKSGEAKELSDIPANLFDKCVSQLKSVGGQSA